MSCYYLNVNSSVKGKYSISKHHLFGFDTVVFYFKYKKMFVDILLSLKVDDKCYFWIPSDQIVYIIQILYLLFLDEEIGGLEGMKKFIKTKDFSNLNVGFALDEGMASPTEEYSLYYGERCIWRKKIDK